jgi:RimJ/RimL family protein N-acetyltransferase
MLMEFRTGRLYIRPVCIEDKDSMFRYRSDADTNKYLSLIPQSVEDIAAFISKTSFDINVPDTWFQFVIIEQASNKLIGDVGIHFLDTDSENRQVEIGYTLDKDFRGKGYATEALKTIIDYLINSLNKHRIVASIDPVNTASIKLIERLGFRKEGHFVESIFFHGKWVDDLVYGVLAKEWKLR